MARNLNEMVSAHIGVQTQFVDLMAQYANGDFGNRMAKLPGERKTISDAAEKVRGEMEAAADAAQYNARVKAALNYVSIPVRIANDDGEILYVNHAMNETLYQYEAAFRPANPRLQRRQDRRRQHRNVLCRCPFRDCPTTPNLQADSIAHVAGRTELRCGDEPCVRRKRRAPGDGWSMGRHHRATCRRKGSRQHSRGRRGRRFWKTHLGSGQNRFMLQMSQGLNAVLSTSESALGEIARILKALAEGDLSQTIEAEFQGVFAELKDDSNGTIETAASIIQQIREAAGSINTAAREIAMGNDDLSRRTEEEASSLEETASSIEELAATVKLNAGNALQANKLAAEASENAMRGGEVMAQVVETMNGITESNREIADITTLIDGIAFQTNILALNAAVEAARAGEQGRGFAVVASEVRNLAKRSAEAAKGIKALISTSVGKADEGAKLVQSAGQAMADIVASVQRVTAIMGEIAAASNEQSDGVQQVDQAISQIDQLTQQNAACSSNKQPPPQKVWNSSPTASSAPSRSSSCRAAQRRREARDGAG